MISIYNMFSYQNIRTLVLVLGFCIQIKSLADAVLLLKIIIKPQTKKQKIKSNQNQNIVDKLNS